MNTPALDILEQKKEALLGTLATGLGILGATHGAYTGGRAAAPTWNPHDTIPSNVGNQLVGLPGTLGGAIGGALPGAIRPFTTMASGIGKGLGLTGQPPTVQDKQLASFAAKPPTTP